MNRETRKQLTSVDISGYSFEINQFEQRLNLRNLSASTFKNYMSCLKLFLAWYIFSYPHDSAEEMEYDSFRAFVQFLVACGFQPRTVNVYIATMKQYRQLVQGKDWNRYELQFLKYDSVLPKVPGIEQVRKMISCTNDLTEKLLLALLLSTGIRISEACALTYGDIRREEKIIHIRPGKGRSDRMVPLTDEVICLLTHYYRETSRQCRSANRPVPGKESQIFRFSDGITPANTNRLRRVFMNVVNRAFPDGTRFTPHSYRHFFALQIYLQKNDLVLVKELLGHHSLSATEVYLRMAAAMGLVQSGYTNPLAMCLDGRVS